MQPRTPPTVATIKDGCVRLAFQLESLRKEVTELSVKLGKFKKGREIPKEIKYGDHLGLDRWKGQTPETPPPRSIMADVDFETKDAENLDISSKALIAIGHGLDGAIREVRAAKATIQAIADDSDLRAEFKDWQQDRE